MKKKKILFFGTPVIAVPSLEKLSELETVEILGVGVFPDRKVGRKQIPIPCPVKQKAQQLGLPVFEIDTKKELEQLFADHPCDMAMVIAFGMIFPKTVLSKPKQGVINIHFSLLPRYRGASPVQSAILAGDQVSGITFQQMVSALDAGDIVYQKAYSIKNKKTSEVFADFAVKSAEEMDPFLNTFFDQKKSPVPQKESEATFCGKFQKSDGEIFPDRETAAAIERKARAFDLFPGIFLSTSKGPLKLLSVSLEKKEESVPLSCDKETTLFIHTAQIPGKKPMPMSDILRGHPDILQK